MDHNKSAPHPVSDAVEALLREQPFDLGVLSPSHAQDVVLHLRNTVLSLRKAVRDERSRAGTLEMERDAARFSLKHNAQTCSDLIRRITGRHDVTDNVLDGINPGDYALRVRELLEAPLHDFVSCINVTGGLTAEDGPVGDPDWLDLADAYLKACQALGVVPMEEPSDNSTEASSGDQG